MQRLDYTRPVRPARILSISVWSQLTTGAAQAVFECRQFGQVGLQQARLFGGVRSEGQVAIAEPFAADRQPALGQPQPRRGQPGRSR